MSKPSAEVCFLSNQKSEAGCKLQVSQVGYQEATNTLVGCSTSGSFVGIWTVPLNRVQPWAREREYGAGQVSFSPDLLTYLFVCAFINFII